MEKRSEIVIVLIRENGAFVRSVNPVLFFRTYYIKFLSFFINTILLRPVIAVFSDGIIVRLFYLVNNGISYELWRLFIIVRYIVICDYFPESPKSQATLLYRENRT